VEAVFSTQYYNLKITHDCFRDDVLTGLLQAKKSIPPKYFYDETGSRLFEQICETEEYYVTRTESNILAQNADDILNAVPGPIALIELGSGSSTKTRLLLQEGSHIVRYVPIDISESYLLASTAGLAARFPEISMIPICADYTFLGVLPPLALGTDETPLLFFPGSTLGNLDRAEALRLLENLHSLIKGEGYFLLGIDLIKDHGVLDSAYNDAQGFTAAFNMNLLQRINRELQGTFDVAKFQHLAFYNEDKERVEMHLVSRCDQVVSVAGKIISFEAGETIHTESSQKYNLEVFDAFTQQAGFQCERVWTDSRRRFAVTLMRAFDRRDLIC
jgi:dimethylhistidine N-methyltransferase